MSLLEVDDIHTFYGSSYVLKGVSLSVREGEVAVLMGRNGVGKTTTIRSIVGFSPPRRGEVRFRGTRASGLPSHRIAALGIGLVPQGPRIFRSLEVEEHLMLGATPPTGPDGWTLETVYALFPRLKERRRQRAATLSGGEQSMVSIARALMMNPSLLLMDEPTEGLAPIVVDQVADVIVELKRRGQSILLVEQDLSLALSIADRILFMARGRIEADLTPREVESDHDVQTRYLGV